MRWGRTERNSLKRRGSDKEDGEFVLRWGRTERNSLKRRGSNKEDGEFVLTCIDSWNTAHIMSR